MDIEDLKEDEELLEYLEGIYNELFSHCKFALCCISSLTNDLELMKKLINTEAIEFLINYSMVLKDDFISDIRPLLDSHLISTRGLRNFCSKVDWI